MHRWLSMLIRSRATVVVVLGVALFLPSLGAGLMADDWFQLAVMEQADFMPARAPLDLFSFVTDQERATDFGSEHERPGWRVQGGFLPWWASDDFSASFFRPLTSLTHLADHRLFGRLAAGHHASSLLLWGALLLMVMRFFETVARDSGRGPLVVLVAGLIYAADDAHAWSIAWLANRNALLCVLFALLSLWLYHLARRDGRRWVWLASLGAYVLALLSGETAIALPMWVLAYEICLGRGAVGQRLRSIAPIMVATVIYLIGWSQLGYGASGSNLYISPFTRPVAFVTEALLERIPLLITGALWPVPAEIGFIFPEHKALVRLLAWICSGLSVAVLWPLLRRDPVCRFMGLGALLALVPMAGTFAHNRLLLFSTVGTSWLLACVLVDWLAVGRDDDDGDGEGRAKTAWWRRRGAWLVQWIVAVHLLGAAPGALMAQGVLTGLSASGERYALQAQIPTRASDDGVRVFALNSIDPISPTYLPLIRWAAGLPLAEAYWSLSIIPGDQVLVRTGERSFQLEAGSPGFLRTSWEGLFRSDAPVIEGDEFGRGVLKVRAVQVEDGELRVIEVQLERSLDDPRTVLLAWNGERMARIQPPAVDECRLLPLDGYGVYLPMPSHPSLSHRCADEVDFMDDPQLSVAPRGGGRGHPQVERPAAEVAQRAQSATPIGGPAGGAKQGASQPCVLELWTGHEWTHHRDMSCPSDGTLRLLSVGDVGYPSPILDASVDQMQRYCAGDRCQLMLVAGDLIYGPGSKADQTWRAVWDEGLAKLGLPGIAVLGNHEYRHEPGPELKRATLFAAHGRAGLVLPAAHYAARLRAGERVLIAIAALDTDSLSLPGPQKPGLGRSALAQACAQGTPVIALGHHPPSSQGRHHTHEAWLERQLRAVLIEASASGCNLVAYSAGHDHDLQAYGPGCEAPGVPAVVVSGVVARGYRAPGSTHLQPCPSAGVQSSYHAGPRVAGGFAVLELDLRQGAAAARLIDVPGPGLVKELGVLRWQFPATRGK